MRAHHHLRRQILHYFHINSSIIVCILSTFEIYEVLKMIKGKKTTLIWSTKDLQLKYISNPYGFILPFYCIFFDILLNSFPCPSLVYWQIVRTHRQFTGAHNLPLYLTR